MGQIRDSSQKSLSPTRSPRRRGWIAKTQNAGTGNQRAGLKPVDRVVGTASIASRRPTKVRKQLGGHSRALAQPRISMPVPPFNLRGRSCQRRSRVVGDRKQARRWFAAARLTGGVQAEPEDPDLDSADAAVRDADPGVELSVVAVDGFAAVVAAGG